MNNVVFSTGGDWDSTTLHNNGVEVAAAQLFVELHAGRDEYGDARRGGVNLGGEMTAIIRPQDDPSQEIGIFPGRLALQFPAHQVIVENQNPAFAFEFTRVWMDGRDITDSVLDLYVDVNAVDNVVKAYAVIYKPHWFGSDEVATFNLL